LEIPAEMYPVDDNLDELAMTDRNVVEDVTPTAPRQLVTSTPPASVKPRSAFVRRVLASQSKEKPKSKRKVEFLVSSSSGLRRSRKSVRMSLPFAKRPSLFGPDLSDDDDAGDDVDRVFDVIRSYVLQLILRLDCRYRRGRIHLFRESIYYAQGHPNSKPI
jgi:hypothetical protein